MCCVCEGGIKALQEDGSIMIDSYVKEVESGDCCLNICKNGEEFQFENDDYGLLDACERKGYDEGTPSYSLIEERGE